MSKPLAIETVLYWQTLAAESPDPSIRAIAYSELTQWENQTTINIERTVIPPLPVRP